MPGFRIPRLAAVRRLLRTHPRLRRLAIGLAAVCGLFLLGLVWLLFPYLRTFGDIGSGPENAPSRLYAQAPEIRVGQEVAPDALAEELAALGYRPWKTDGELPHGRYRLGDDALAVRLRRHVTPQGWVPGDLLLVQFRRGKVSAVRAGGQPVEKAALESPVLATYYGDEAREKWPVKTQELPEHVARAVLAAEDDSFYWHPGVSPTGIARALSVNLRRAR